MVERVLVFFAVLGALFFGCFAIVQYAVKVHFAHGLAGSEP